MLEKELANAINQLEELERADSSSDMDELRRENLRLLARLEEKDLSNRLPRSIDGKSTSGDQLTSGPSVAELEAKLESALSELASGWKEVLVQVTLCHTKIIVKLWQFLRRIWQMRKILSPNFKTNLRNRMLRANKCSMS